MSETITNYHECTALRNIDNISIQKIKNHWYWVFWNDKKGNRAYGIAFCPYCGKRLQEDGGTKE